MTGLNIGVGGAWKAAKPFVGVGGAWKAVNAAWVGVGGVWKQFYTAMTASAGGPGWSFNAAGGFWEADTWFCGVTGGTGPYTYAWSSPDPNVGFTGATATVTLISATGNLAAINCLVTDANGATATAMSAIS